jgi:hypothetical protein
MKNYSRTTFSQLPAPIIKNAKANGVNKESKFKGKTLIFLLSIDLYQSLNKEVKKGKERV